jgi:hypothetical protein
MLLRTAACLCLAAACTATPEAPDIENRDAGNSNADASAPAPDSGFPDYDSGPSVFSDAGDPDVAWLPQDAGAVRPGGTFDAGYNPELPEDPPPLGDPCAETCVGRPCAEACRNNCRFALPGMPESQRAGFLGCIAQNTCDTDQCMPDVVIPEACEDLCENGSRRRCDLDIGDNQSSCRRNCLGWLTLMTPPAREAFLQCGIERCSRNNSINCNPASFLGPTPSQTCIDVGLRGADCGDDQRRNPWQIAWECEGWRSPVDQGSLGGNVLVECLAGAECGGGAFYGCMIESQAATGRRARIGELCDGAARCGEPNIGCQLINNGMTRLVGEVGLAATEVCLEAAGADCDAIGSCLQRNWDPGIANAPELCRQSCIRCGEATDACVNTCTRLRHSMSLAQGATYDRCLTNRAAANDCGTSIGITCLTPALPQVAQHCQSYVNHLVATCSGVRYYNPELLVGWCALGGVRTGLADAETFIECVDRTGCGVNTWEACSR